MKYTTLIIFQMEHFPQNVYSKEFYFVKFSTYFFLCFNPILFLILQYLLFFQRYD